MEEKVVDELNKIVENHFGNNEKPHVYVIGGIHGNEFRSMEGTQFLVDYLKENQTELSKKILENLKITIVPILNVVGNLAGVRFCPSKGTKVQVKDGKIVNLDHNKLPSEWNDPNRGWDENNTLCKDYLSEIIKENPEYIIFNHDWHSHKGIIYGYCGQEEFKKVSHGIEDVYYEFYSKLYDINGDMELITEHHTNTSKKDYENYTTNILNDKYGIKNILIENYIFHKRAAESHFALTLYLLFKIAGLEISPEDVLRDVKVFTEDHMIETNYPEEKEMIILQKSGSHYGFLTKK